MRNSGLKSECRWLKSNPYIYPDPLSSQNFSLWACMRHICGVDLRAAVFFVLTIYAIKEKFGKENVWH
jgi:hypothetical protein